jgi:hypothetical protein
VAPASPCRLSRPVAGSDRLRHGTAQGKHPTSAPRCGRAKLSRSPPTHHPAALGGPSPSPPCVHILLTTGCSASEARQVVDDALVVKVPPQLGMWSTGTPSRPLRRLPTLPVVHMSDGGAACPRANAPRSLDEAVCGWPAQPGPEQRACAIGRGPEELGPTPPGQPGRRGRIGERSDRYSAEGRGACLIRNNVQLLSSNRKHSRDRMLHPLLSFLITQTAQHLEGT